MQLLLLEDFNKFGQKYDSSSPVDILSDEETKFRRHIEIQSERRPAGTHLKRSEFSSRKQKNPIKKVRFAFNKKIDPRISSASQNDHIFLPKIANNHIHNLGTNRKNKSFENLITSQFKRVMKTARNLQIKTGFERNTKDIKTTKEYFLISPKGSVDEGSLAFVRINPDTKRPQIKTSVNFSIMKGPYEDSYHRQLHNDAEGVAAILGKSAKKGSIPTLNSVLSKIILNSPWEIMKLR